MSAVKQKILLLSEDSEHRIPAAVHRFSKCLILRGGGTPSRLEQYDFTALLSERLLFRVFAEFMKVPVYAEKVSSILHESVWVWGKITISFI